MANSGVVKIRVDLDVGNSGAAIQGVQNTLNNTHFQLNNIDATGAADAMRNAISNTQFDVSEVNINLFQADGALAALRDQVSSVMQDAGAALGASMTESVNVALQNVSRQVGDDLIAAIELVGSNGRGGGNGNGRRDRTRSVAETVNRDRLAAITSMARSAYRSSRNLYDEGQNADAQSRYNDILERTLGLHNRIRDVSNAELAQAEAIARQYSEDVSSQLREQNQIRKDANATTADGARLTEEQIRRQLVLAQAEKAVSQAENVTARMNSDAGRAAAIENATQAKLAYRDAVDAAQRGEWEEAEAAIANVNARREANEQLYRDQQQQERDTQRALRQTQQETDRQTRQVQRLNDQLREASFINARDNTEGPAQFNTVAARIQEIQGMITALNGLSGDERAAQIFRIEDAISHLHDPLVAAQQDIDALQSRMSSFLSQNPQAANVFGDAIRRMSEEARNASPERLEALTAQFRELQQITNNNMLGGKGFMSSISQGLKMLTGFDVVQRGMMYARNGVKAMVKNTTEIDAAMTELKRITHLTSTEYEMFGDQAAHTAKDLGASVRDTIQASADFARLGYYISDSAELAKAALVYKNVGYGITSVETATESLISTLKAFDIQSSETMHIVDKFNEVGNNYAISSSGVGEALVRSAAALSTAGNTIDESIGLVTAMNSVVQDPSQVGTSLKTLTMYLRAAKTEAESAGVETDGMAESVAKLQGQLKSLTGVDIMKDSNTFKSTYQIVKELAGVWDQLSDVSRANVLNLIGGKRNANVISSLLTNFDTAEAATKTSMESAGSALRENEKYLESINGKVDILKANFEDLSTNVINGGAVKGVIDIANIFTKLAVGASKIGIVAPTLIALFTAMKSAKLAKGVGSMAGMLGSTMVDSDKIRTLQSFFLTLSRADQITAFQRLSGMAGIDTTLVNTAAGLANVNTQTTSLTASMTAMGNVTRNAFGLMFSGWNGVLTAISLVATVYGAISSMMEADRQKTVQAGNDVVERYNQSTEDYKNNLKQLNSMRARYMELSEGVSHAEGSQGENLSLTNDEYNEYLDLVGKIIEISPDIEAHYNGQIPYIDNYSSAIDRAIDLQNDFLKNEEAIFIAGTNDMYASGKQKFKDLYGSSVGKKSGDVMNAFGAIGDNILLSAIMGDDSDGFVYENGWKDRLDDSTDAMYRYLVENGDSIVGKLRMQYGDMVSNGLTPSFSKGDITNLQNSISAYTSEYEKAYQQAYGDYVEGLHKKIMQENSGLDDIMADVPVSMLDSFWASLDKQIMHQLTSGASSADVWNSVESTIRSTVPDLVALVNDTVTEDGTPLLALSRTLADDEDGKKKLISVWKAIQATAAALFQDDPIAQALATDFIGKWMDEDVKSLEKPAQAYVSQASKYATVNASLKDINKEASTSFELLGTAIDEVRDKGEVSASTMEKMQDALKDGENFSDFFSVGEDGKLAFNAEAWRSRSDKIYNSAISELEHAKEITLAEQALLKGVQQHDAGDNHEGFGKFLNGEYGRKLGGNVDYELTITLSPKIDNQQLLDKGWDIDKNGNPMMASKFFSAGGTSGADFEYGTDVVLDIGLVDSNGNVFDEETLNGKVADVIKAAQENGTSITREASKQGLRVFGAFAADGESIDDAMSSAQEYHRLVTEGVAFGTGAKEASAFNLDSSLKQQEESLQRISVLQAALGQAQLEYADGFEKRYTSSGISTTLGAIVKQSGSAATALLKTRNGFALTAEEVSALNNEYGDDKEAREFIDMLNEANGDIDGQRYALGKLSGVMRDKYVRALDEASGYLNGQMSEGLDPGNAAAILSTLSMIDSLRQDLSGTSFADIVDYQSDQDNKYEKYNAYIEAAQKYSDIVEKNNGLDAGTTEKTAANYESIKKSVYDLVSSTDKLGAYKDYDVFLKHFFDENGLLNTEAFDKYWEAYVASAEKASKGIASVMRGIAGGYMEAGKAMEGLSKGMSNFASAGDLVNKVKRDAMDTGFASSDTISSIINAMGGDAAQAFEMVNGELVINTGLIEQWGDAVLDNVPGLSDELRDAIKLTLEYERTSAKTTSTLDGFSQKTSALSGAIDAMSGSTEVSYDMFKKFIDVDNMFAEAFKQNDKGIWEIDRSMMQRQIDGYVSMQEAAIESSKQTLIAEQSALRQRLEAGEQLKDTELARFDEIQSALVGLDLQKEALINLKVNAAGGGKGGDNGKTTSKFTQARTDIGTILDVAYRHQSGKYGNYGSDEFNEALARLGITDVEGFVQNKGNLKELSSIYQKYFQNAKGGQQRLWNNLKGLNPINANGEWDTNLSMQDVMSAVGVSNPMLLGALFSQMGMGFFKDNGVNSDTFWNWFAEQVAGYEGEEKAKELAEEQLQNYTEGAEEATEENPVEPKINTGDAENTGEEAGRDFRKGAQESVDDGGGIELPAGNEAESAGEAIGEGITEGIDKGLKKTPAQQVAEKVKTGNAEPDKNQTADISSQIAELQGAIDQINSTQVSVLVSTEGAEEAAGALAGVASAANSIPRSITISVRYSVEGGPPSVGGVAAAKGGVAMATGNALIGELGPEIVVDPNSGTWHLAGQHGAEFTRLPKDAIVFDAEKTRAIMSGGHSNARGMALAHGTSGKAYAMADESSAGIGGISKPGNLGRGGDDSSSSSSKNSSKSVNYKKLQKDLEKLNKELEHYIKHQEYLYDLGEKSKNFKMMSDSLTEQVAIYRRMADAADEALQKAKASKKFNEAKAEKNEEYQKIEEAYWKAQREIWETIEKLNQVYIEALNDKIDEFQDAYNTLASAAEEFSKQGGMSTDTFQELLENGVQYLAYLDEIDGQYVINEDAINRVIAAEKEQLAIESALSYLAQVRQAIADNDTNVLNNLANANYHVSDSAWSAVEAQLAMLETAGGLTREQYDSIASNITKLRNLAKGVITDVYTEREKAQGKVEKLYDKQKDALDDLLDKTKELIKYEINQQKDALKKQIDDYKEIVDLKKESLKTTKDEYDYQKKLEDKTADMAKLQLQIDQLALDDSREARAKRAELQEDLKKLQDDLSDLQYDHAYDKQVEALEKQAEEYQKKKEEEIEELEKRISSEEKLYQLAMDRIATGWDTLYNDLIDYNTEAGNVINEEITKSWKTALDAVKQYGSYVTALTQLKKLTGEDDDDDDDNDHYTIVGNVDGRIPDTDEIIRGFMAEKLGVDVVGSIAKPSSSIDALANQISKASDSLASVSQTYNNGGDFNPTFNITISHSGSMSASDARAYGKEIGEYAADVLHDAFLRRGVTSL